MTCADIRTQLTALLDGEMPKITESKIQDHLLSCTACAQAHQELTRLQAGASPWETESADLWPDVRERIAIADQSALLKELREMREEMQALRREMADLRREISKRPPPPAIRGTSLSFPDAPERTFKRYQMV